MIFRRQIKNIKSLDFCIIFSIIKYVQIKHIKKNYKIMVGKAFLIGLLYYY